MAIRPQDSHRRSLKWLLRGVGLGVLGLGALAFWPSDPGPTLLDSKSVEAAPVNQLAPQEPRDLFEGAVAWLNTAKPIASTDLKGKIVLLDFWTYCCINCHHILPDLRKLEEKYKDELVVIGIHSPKFEAERETENIRQKVREYEIKHPVANDADRTIWNRFGVNAWPTLALIDANGKYRGSVSGEGHYELLDEVIGKLVAEHKAKNELDLTPFVVYAESDRPSDGPLLYPGKVLADPTGNRLFITDTGHNRIVITDLQGKKLDVVGSGQQGLKDGDFQTAQFNRPQGVCLVDEILYVADTENHALRGIDLARKQVSTLAGDGTQSNIRAGEGPGKEMALNSPWAVIQIPATQTLAIAMAGPHQIWKYDTAQGIVSVWAGSGRENIIDGSYDSAAFAQPSGLATDGKFLYVADSEVSGIRAVSLSGDDEPQVQTVVGMGLFEFGDIDGRGDTVRLQHCLGVDYADGILYIADTYNNKIKVCKPASREVEALVGTRDPGSSDTAPSFYQPGGVSVGGKNLYVADTNNHAIRVVNLETKETSTLKLDGVQPPEPPRRKPTFRNPATASEAPVQVAPGSNFEIRVKIEVPGYKLAPETPILYLVEAPDAPAVLSDDVSETGTRLIPEGSEFRVPVTLASPSRAGDSLNLKLSASIFVCSETSGFCTMKNFVWTIPVQFKAGANGVVEVTTPNPDAAQKP